jgi:hypothetical protein
MFGVWSSLAWKKHASILSNTLGRSNFITQVKGGGGWIQMEKAEYICMIWMYRMMWVEIHLVFTLGNGFQLNE